MATPAIAPRSTRATPALRPHPDDAALAFRLPALDRSVRVARARTREALAGWGLAAQVVENAELVVSELVTNAVLHTGSQAVVCTLRAGEGLLRVEVADQRTTAPHPPGGSARARAARAEDERGRGLILVEALSTAWGVSPGPDGRGKAIWALLPREAAAPEPHRAPPAPSPPPSPPPASVPAQRVAAQQVAAHGRRP